VLNVSYCGTDENGHISIVDSRRWYPSSTKTLGVEPRTANRAVQASDGKIMQSGSDWASRPIFLEYEHYCDKHREHVNQQTGRVDGLC